MSKRDVDTVRAQFAATNDGDFERAMDLYTEDVELVVASDAFLERGTFAGKDAVGRWFANWFATFEPGYRFEIEQARDLGPKVFIDASHRGRGRTSGAQVEGRTGYLYTVRDGKIVGVELFPTPADALEAGLS